MNPNKRYPCETCGSPKAVKYFDDGSAFCHACWKQIDQKPGSDEYVYRSQGKDEEPEFYADELAKPLAQILQPSDLKQEWVSKRKYTNYEISYLQSHGDFGTLTVFDARTLGKEYEKEGKPTKILDDYLSNIHIHEINNNNLVICRDFDGEPSGFQHFFKDFHGIDQKFYGPYSKRKPTIVRFDGPDPEVIFVGEGVATCLGVFFLLDMEYTCVSFLDANALIKHLPEFMDRHPGVEFVIIGDDDYKPEKPDMNKGKEVAKRFEKVANSAFPLRSWEQYDWDDVFRATLSSPDDIHKKLACEVLKKAIKPKVTYGPFKTPNTEEVSLDVARDVVTTIVSEVFDSANDINSRATSSGYEGLMEMYDKPGNNFNEEYDNRVMILDFVPGVGKTSACLDQIVRLLRKGTDMKFEILAHTHHKCDEIMTDLCKKMLPVVGVEPGQIVHRKGMSKDSCDHPVIRTVLSHNESENRLYEKFCRKCSYRNSCAFISSNKDINRAQILISTHAYARYRNKKKLSNKEYPLVIIDEDPLHSFASDTIQICLSKGDGVEKEHRKIFEQACEDLVKYEDGLQTLDAIPLSVYEAYELSKILYKNWEDAYVKCIIDCNGNSDVLFALLNKRKVPKHPPVKSRFWSKMGVPNAQILKRQDTIYIQTPPRFRRYHKSVNIIITDAKANHDIYHAMFPNSVIRSSVFLDVPIDEKASHFQIVENNYVNLRREQQKILAKGVTNLLEGKNSALISNKAVLDDINAEVSYNFTSALGTNGLEQKELLVVIGWQRPPPFEIELLAFNLFGEDALDNEWIQATETVLGKTVNRGHYPSNPYVQDVYHQLLRKPVYHAINRLRPIIPNRHKRTTILISNQFVSDKLEKKTSLELNLPYRIEDSAMVGIETPRNSQDAWVFKIIEALKIHGKIEFKLTKIAEAIGTQSSGMKEIGKAHLRHLLLNTEVEIIEEPGPRKGREKEFLVLKENEQGTNTWNIEGNT